MKRWSESQRRQDAKPLKKLLEERVKINDRIKPYKHSGMYHAIHMMRCAHWVPQGPG